MRALTVTPGEKSSLRLRDIPEPEADEGNVLVESLAVGLCGTDSEIVAAEYGLAPTGHDFLVLGHENLGRVLEAPADSGLAEGDLVVGIVRRPDPKPCKACAAGEWDMCLNGGYTEHGIKGLDGFARERWRGEPQAMVQLDSGLAEADGDWLRRLITRRVPLASFAEAFERHPEDVKVVLDVKAGADR